MSTIFESKSEKPEHPVDPSPDRTEADSHKRAECAERISRLLSAFDGGPSTGKTQYLTKEVIRKTKTNPDSDTSTRFLLVNRNGPIGEFGSWEDASQYRNDLHHQGASIIGVETKPLEPGEVREKTANQPANPPTNQPTNQSANQPAMITGGVNSPNSSTIQELNKADDPGDARPNSLPQAGALPANSKVMRVVGKIFPAAAKTVTLNACPQFFTNRYELLVLGNTSAQITNVVGFGNLTLTCAPPAANYGTINIHYTAELTNASNRS